MDGYVNKGSSDSDSEVHSEHVEGSAYTHVSFQLVSNACLHAAYSRAKQCIYELHVFDRICMKPMQ